MQKQLSHGFVLLGLILLFVASAFQVTARTAVDPTYNGVPSLSVFPGNGVPTTLRQAVQADGKVLVWGGALAIEGVAKGRLARLNVDGTLDTSFTFCECGLDTFSNAAPLPDGKILAAGSAQATAKVIRLNNDGSVDSTFNFVPSVTGNNSRSTIVAVRPDGSFFATRVWAQFGFGGIDLYRFNANGSEDTSFSHISIGSGSPNFSSLGAVEVLPDGRVYVATNTAAPFNFVTSLKRYTATGATDSTWETPSFSNPGASSGAQIYGLDTQTDGSLLVAGVFATVNGFSKPNLVRLLPAGNVDLGFMPPAVFQGGTVKAVADGKILFSFGGSLGTGTSIMRLLPDGTPDSSFSMEPGLFMANPWVIDANERVIFLANDGVLTRLLVTGARDTSFSQIIDYYGRVHALARQSDGKVIVAGDFTRFNGISQPSIVRTNSDGSLDGSFNGGTGFSSPPKKIILQADGKLLAIGSFSSYNGTAVPGIVRLLSNGAIDPGFSVAPNAGAQFQGITLMTDGRILVTGNFASINGISRPGVARLNTDGSLDASFNALLGGTPNVYDVVVQADGKIVIGGIFFGVQGFNRSNFVRLDSSGVLDQGFNPSVGGVGGIWLTPDGKFLITGFPGDQITLQRRNSDGSADASYTTPTFIGDNSQSSIDAVLVQSDGSAIVGGNFYTVGSNLRKGIVRLTPSGSVDPLFLPLSTDGRVTAVVDGGPGKVLIGGDFSQVELSTRAGLARLNVSPYRKVTLFDFNGDGLADFTVFRPSTNDWYRLYSGGMQYDVTNFGLSGDIVAPGDFDGDGKTDIAIYRPSNGAWWYAASSLGGAFRTVSWGINGDIPRPADFDGDGKTDFILFRPSNSTWYRMNSSGTQSAVAFGLPGDLPTFGDYDGDGKADLAIFRPSTGTWWYAASSAGGQHRAIRWGQAGDIPVPGDYDGDGKTDVAVFRPSEGGWYIANTSDGSVVTMSYGLPTDKPVPADYDGDGKTDVAVFRPSTGVWYLLQSSAGQGGVQWGISTDVPAPSAFWQ